MELDDGDLAVPGLGHGPLEVLERPGGPRIARRRDEERVVAAGLISKSSSPIIGELGRSTAAGEFDPTVTQERQHVPVQRVARIGKRDRPRDAVLLAPSIDRLDLFPRAPRIFGAGGLVVAGVVADLEAILV